MNTTINTQDFNFAIQITRAYIKDGKRMIEGIASTTELDSHETIFNRSAQQGFAFDINSNAGTDDPVQIEIEHKGAEAPVMVIGVLTRAEVTENDELYVEGELDEVNPLAVYYHEILSNPDPKKGRPKKLGLSINGYVKEAHREFNEQLKKYIDVFDRVVLKKVGIVRAPSNSSTWVQKIARSVNWNALEENVMLKDKDNAVEQVDEKVVAEEVSTDSEVVREDEVQDENKDADTANEVVVDETGDKEADEEVNREKVEDAESQDNVLRANYWTSVSLLEAMGSLMNGVLRVESALMEDNYFETLGDADKESLKSSLTQLDEVMRKIAGAFLTASSSECGEEGEEESMERSEESENTNKDDSEEVAETRSEVKVAVDTDSIKDMLNEFRTSLMSDIDEKLNEVRSEITSSKESLQEVSRKLEKAEEENGKLVERLTKVEKSPVSAPGGQMLGDNIVREQLNKDQERKLKRLMNIERAKEENDRTELTKFYFDPNYLGKY